MELVKLSHGFAVKTDYHFSICATPTALQYYLSLAQCRPQIIACNTLSARYLSPVTVSVILTVKVGDK